MQQTCTSSWENVPFFSLFFLEYLMSAPNQIQVWKRLVKVGELVKSNFVHISPSCLFFHQVGPTTIHLAFIVRARLKSIFNSFYACKVFGLILYSKLNHNIYLPFFQGGIFCIPVGLLQQWMKKKHIFILFHLYWTVCIVMQNCPPGVIPVPQSSLVGHCAKVLVLTKPDVFFFHILYLLSYP